jgi:nucleotide-binding universal stress UspA family protein
MAGPIVVGYDGTASARAALDEAVRLAGALGVELVVAFA